MRPALALLTHFPRPSVRLPGHPATIGAVVAAALLVASLPGRAEHSAPGAPQPNPALPPYALGIFDGSIGEMQALDAGFTRVSMAWGNHEGEPGVYGWESLDEIVVPPSQAGLRVVVMIHANSPWGSECESLTKFSAPKKQYLRYFRAFVRKMVERYDGDGVDDAPGLGVPVKYWQVENQWITTAFFRGSDNCFLAAGGGVAADTIAPGRGRRTGNPSIAAREYVREYIAAAEGVKRADPEARVGPGNIPSLAADAALFCIGRTGDSLPQNLLDDDGNVVRRLEWSHDQVCSRAGPDPRGIKTWVRYWNPVLEQAMARIASRSDFIDLAQYGRYQDIPLRNQWILERARLWGARSTPLLLAWEVAGPDRRTTDPSPKPRTDAAYDLPKRLALAFATGTRSAAWFHNHESPAASVATRFTSLVDAGGRRTPAYWSYRLFTGLTRGATGVRLQSLRGGAGYLVVFAVPGGRRVLLAWSESGLDAKLAIRSANVDIVTVTGRRQSPAVSQSLSGHRLALHLGPAPIFVIEK